MAEGALIAYVEAETRGCVSARVSVIHALVEIWVAQINGLAVKRVAGEFCWAELLETTMDARVALSLEIYGMMRI